MVCKSIEFTSSLLDCIISPHLILCKYKLWSLRASPGFTRAAFARAYKIVFSLGRRAAGSFAQHEDGDERGKDYGAYEINRVYVHAGVSWKRVSFRGRGRKGQRAAPGGGGGPGAWKRLSLSLHPLASSTGRFCLWALCLPPQGKSAVRNRGRYARLA